MIIIHEERASDSPFVERVWCSHSEGAHPFLSIAVNHCEFVVSRLQGKVTIMLRGPETKATPIGNAPAEGEWVGILLKPGTFLPHLPTGRLVDDGVDLPTASSNSFWLGGSAWRMKVSMEEGVTVRPSQQDDHKGRPYYAPKRFARLVHSRGEAGPRPGWRNTHLRIAFTSRFLSVKVVAHPVVREETVS
jgi:hypothetical protein